MTTRERPLWRRGFTWTCDMCQAPAFTPYWALAPLVVWALGGAGLGIYGLTVDDGGATLLAAAVTVTGLAIAFVLGAPAAHAVRHRRPAQ